jgi:transmembrane sensor
MQVAGEAAEWLGILSHDSPQDHEAFAKWVTASRLHVEEFLFATVVDRVLDRVDASRRLDVERILERAKANVVALETQVSRHAEVSLPQQTRRWAWVATIATCVVATMGVIWLIVQPSFGGKTFRTAVGEQRRIELPDGSSVYLNTRSQVRIRYSAHQRDVELTAGEALFDVKGGTSRPFRVLR